MRTKKITYNRANYQPGIAETIYGKGDYKIKQQKVVTRTTPRKTVTRTVDYGPVNYYGKQTKTRSRRVTWK